MIRNGKMGENLGEIIRIGRFRFLIAGFLLYLMGALAGIYGGGAFDLSGFMLGYLAAGAGHLSVHYSNEYFDRESDRFGTPSAISGGSGVLVRRPDLADTARRIALFLIAISVTAGLMYVIRWPDSLSLFALVLTGNLLGWFYSAPPLRFVARGWGEMATALVIGCVLPGMGFLVTAGEFNLNFMVFSVPLFCYGCYFMMNVEIPDEYADRQAGKMTLIVKHGGRFGLQVVLASALCATLWYLVLSPFKEGIVFIALFSAIPLAGALWGYTKMEEMQIQSTLVQGNIATLVLFCLLVDGYLLTIVMP